MNIITEKNKEQIIVKVSGRLDGSASPDFDKGTKDLELKGTHIILDFKELEYLSSAGLRSILALARRAKSAGGSVSIRGISESVNEVLEISGFSKIIPIIE